MTSAGYTDYAEYRMETNRRTPHTVERHRAKLIKKLDTLYSQQDYRALETIMELVDALASDADKDRYYSLYLTLMRLPTATESQLTFCKAFLR